MSRGPSLRRAPGSPPLPATPFRFIWYFVDHYRWGYLAMVVLTAADAAAGILVPYALGRVVKSLEGDVGGARTADLQVPLLLFVGFTLAGLVFGRAAGAIQLRLGPRQRQNVTRQLYHYLQLHSYRFFSGHFAGALAHRISETALGVTQTLWTFITELWPVAISIGVAVFLLFRAHVWLGAFALAWALTFIGISYVLARRCQPYALRSAQARSTTTGAIVDSVTNLTSTRLFARLDFERDHLEGHLRHELSAILASNGYSERIRWFQFTGAAAFKVGVLFLSVHFWRAGRISVGEFVMAVSLALLVINETRNLSRRFMEVFESLGNVANGVRTIVQSHELVDEPNALPLGIGRGEVRFENVSFGYDPRRPLFEKLDVRIAPGQHVGLVGVSGSGKSSFVSLLLRLFDPQEGSIRVDGHDVRELTQDALHSQIGLIPQDPSLFHRSLRDNIRYGRSEASDDEVTAASLQAQAHDFIQSTPGGYDALVGERGVKLSGGQRQRVAIARVLLKNAPLLILDEATSALDSITERAIADTLQGLMRGKTVIVIAHRLSTVASLDRILVFDAGRIVEDGSHQELLERRGAYFSLWSRQADGFLPERPAPHAAAPHSAVHGAAPNGAVLEGAADTAGRARAPTEEPERANG
ncbi:MAG TPA: ABC transporter ATP-binding protein [Polyangiaceae bacterium]|nr:ABC transporter ATP-binding protein [Polyangiaceae bacterium]